MNNYKNLQKRGTLFFLINHFSLQPRQASEIIAQSIVSLVIDNAFYHNLNQTLANLVNPHSTNLCFDTLPRLLSQNFIGREDGVESTDLLNEPVLF